MIGGGENMTEETRRYIERVWKTDFILSYGQTEAFGAIGMESLAKDGYHLNEFHNLFEIVDTDKEGTGELVYTTLNRRVMPFLRYKSGDLTRFIKGPSKSGLPGRRITKLKGRVNEWTATGFGNPLIDFEHRKCLRPTKFKNLARRIWIGECGHHRLRHITYENRLKPRFT